ncbi:MAG: hypothetical protein IKX43_08285 [Paludibacteraceae bacterium]|nr:hypothetical protein [Paludibacteraceae bacterium]
MKKILLIVLCAFYALGLCAEGSSDHFFSRGLKFKTERSVFGFLWYTDLEDKISYLSVSHALAFDVGYQQDEHFYYGVGVECRRWLYDFCHPQLALPIYGEFRMSLSDKKISPYFGLKLGGSVNLIGHDHEDYNIFQREGGRWFYNYNEYHEKLCGLYINPEVGVRFRTVCIGFSIPVMEQIRKSMSYSSYSHVTRKERGKNMTTSFHLTISVIASLTE